MGAEYDERIFDAKGLKAAKREVEAAIKECQYAHGHSGYTGTFAECPGTTFNPTVFGSVEKARTYINEKAVKWEDAVLTRFYEPEGIGGIRWIVGGVFSS